MSTRIPTSPVKVSSPRVATLERAAASLHDDAGAHFAAAATAGTTVKDEGFYATVQAGVAAVSVDTAIDHGLALAGNLAEGALLATAGAVVRVAEEIGDLAGRALQLLGRAMIAIGNALRSMMGGPQIVVADLAKAGGDPSLSSKLFGASKDSFVAAAASLDKGLEQLISAGTDLGGATVSVLKAAQALAVTAAHVGAGAALGAAGVAVDAAALAVDAAERGADNTGSLLQAAGKALVVAGNAINTAVGTDTTVRPR